MTEIAGSVAGLCEPWTDATAALDCCPALTDTDLTVLEQTVELASGLLYELSGRRYPGVCERTVRPCPGQCGCFAGLPPAVNVTWTDGGWVWAGFHRRGCPPVSTVKLAGYPVREILDVTIDGATVDPSGYRLQRRHELIRLADTDGKAQRWPGCQRLDLDDGPGTFFITYLYGADAPLAGRLAAGQLACELAKQCPGSGTDGDCDLPAGTVRVVRQGITVEVDRLTAFLSGGVSGLTYVDAFLTAYGRKIRNRPAVWSPEAAVYAQEA